MLYASPLYTTPKQNLTRHASLIRLNRDESMRVKYLFKTQQSNIYCLYQWQSDPLPSRRTEPRVDNLSATTLGFYPLSWTTAIVRILAISIFRTQQRDMPSVGIEPTIFTIIIRRSNRLIYAAAKPSSPMLICLIALSMYLSILTLHLLLGLICGSQYCQYCCYSYMLLHIIN